MRIDYWGITLYYNVNFYINWHSCNLYCTIIMMAVYVCMVYMYTKINMRNDWERVSLESVWISMCTAVRIWYWLQTQLNVFIPVHQTADFFHHGVECLRLVSMDMMPRPPHIMHSHIGVRSQLLHSLSSTAVHPWPGTVDKCERDGGYQARANTVDHRPFSPAYRDLHLVECIFTPGRRREVLVREKSSEDDFYYSPHPPSDMLHPLSQSTYVGFWAAQW